MPPVAGIPPKAANNWAFVGVVPVQTVNVPFVPALAGAACSVTVTVAVALPVHGAVAVTV